MKFHERPEYYTGRGENGHTDRGSTDCPFGPSDVRFAKDVLKSAEELGQNVFVLGGGSVGIEVVEYLNRHLGKNVTVIEMLDKNGGISVNSKNALTSFQKFGN